MARDLGVQAARYDFIRTYVEDYRRRTGVDATFVVLPTVWNAVLDEDYEPDLSPGVRLRDRVRELGRRSGGLSVLFSHDTDMLPNKILVGGL